MQQKYRRPTAAHSGAEDKQEGRCMDMRVFMHRPSDHLVRIERLHKIKNILDISVFLWYFIQV